MHLDRYECSVNISFSEFEFISEGPKGKIKKMVRFIRMFGNLYNLGFGDFEGSSGKINDIIITNNNDSLKVLATVGFIIHDFTSKNPNSFILIKGSTLSRTRLYRRGVSKYWDYISVEFVVYGQRDGDWELFKFNENYTAFLVHRK